MTPTHTDDRTEQIRTRYNRIAPLYDLLERPMERKVAQWRAELLSLAEGSVLEVGVGTGKNLPYYPSDVSVTAIDFSPQMIERAYARVPEHAGHRYALREMNVEHLYFPDDSFDTMVSTCVFCSVPLPVKGLSEVRRVMKPGGTLLMLEHVRSNGMILGPLMDLVNPLPVHIYGANINRRTVDNLKAAGFGDIQVTDLWADIMKRIVVHVAET